jgi:LPS O-antigen subunit length determinant protein (WzzB/FepE family)
MADIRDIKGLVPIPHGWWLLWALLAVAVAVALWLYLRKRAKPETAVVEPPLTPYEQAIQALQQLLDENLIERGEVDAFYTRLSDIVRQYLEDRFHLRAPERTTEEFLYEVARDNTLMQEHKDLLGRFLRESDLVKFARFQPEQTDMRRAFEAARKFIEDTRPAVQQEALAAAEL